MNSYYQKKEAAHKKILSGKFDKRENVLGQMVEEKPYHVMYSPGFAGYFTYKILCDYGSLDESRQHTPWGFEYYDDLEDYSPYYREAPADFEYGLNSSDVIPWLEKYYGNLAEAEDYDYLITIVESAYNSSGVSFMNAPYNKELALKWLNSKSKAKAEQNAESLPDSIGLGLQWNGPRSELVEMMCGLFEAGILTPISKGGRAAAIDRICKAFGVEGKTPVNVVIQELKQRNADRQAPLFDRAKQALLLYLNRN